MERQVAERDQHCIVLEDQINSSRLDSKHLQIDVEFHKQKIEETNAKNCELEENQRKCMVELEEKYQKLRHANVDFDNNCSGSTTGGFMTPSTLTPGSEKSGPI